MIEPGKYTGRAVEAVLGITSTGKEQIAVVLELDDPPGARITWYGYFTEATEERTIESLRYMGWRGLDMAVFAYGSPLPAEMQETVEVVVEYETDDRGAQRARVRWINRTGGLTVKDPMDATRAAAFAQRMRARLAQYDQKAGTPAPRQAQPSRSARPASPAPSQPVGDDDIPF